VELTAAVYTFAQAGCVGFTGFFKGVNTSGEDHGVDCFGVASSLSSNVTCL